METKPFVFGVAAAENFFVGRKKETERLLQNFQHGVNTVLISPRRLGKTSLVKKVCGLAQSDKLRIVYLDVFMCRSDVDFYNAFASAILRQTSSGLDELQENAKQFLSRTSPRLSTGANPMISLEIDPGSSDIDEILSLPEKIAQRNGCSFVVCIDGFQQIAEIVDSKIFLTRLRSAWQLQNSVSYCLSGSKKHLMKELFEKKSQPFYKFGDTLYLQKIGTQDWIDFICGRFEAAGKHISGELAERICRKVDNLSFYVQQLAWLVWVHADRAASEQDIEAAWQDLIDQNTPLFEKQIESLTAYQMNFLRAVIDGVSSEFTTRDVLQRYQLGSSANVSVVKRALVKKDIIEIEQHLVAVSDSVMAVWLKRELGV